MTAEISHVNAEAIAIATALACLPAIVLACVGTGIHLFLVRRLPFLILSEGISVRGVVYRSLLAGACVGALSFAPLPAEIIMLMAATALSIATAVIAWHARTPLPSALLSVAATAGGMLVDAGLAALIIFLTKADVSHAPVAWQILMWWPFLALPTLAASCISGALSTLQQSAPAETPPSRHAAIDTVDYRTQSSVPPASTAAY